MRTSPALFLSVVSCHVLASQQGRCSRRAQPTEHALFDTHLFWGHGSVLWIVHRLDLLEQALCNGGWVNGLVDGWVGG
jgi:hypothetical protein